MENKTTKSSIYELSGADNASSVPNAPQSVTLLGPSEKDIKAKHFLTGVQEGLQSAGLYSAQLNKALESADGILGFFESLLSRGDRYANFIAEQVGGQLWELSRAEIEEIGKHIGGLYADSQWHTRERNRVQDGSLSVEIRSRAKANMLDDRSDPNDPSTATDITYHYQRIEQITSHWLARNVIQDKSTKGTIEKLNEHAQAEVNRLNGDGLAPHPIERIPLIKGLELGKVKKIENYEAQISENSSILSFEEQQLIDSSNMELLGKAIEQQFLDGMSMKEVVDGLVDNGVDPMMAATLVVDIQQNLIQMLAQNLQSQNQAYL